MPDIPTFGDDFREAVEKDLKGIITKIFLCGSAIPENDEDKDFDIRFYLKGKIEGEFGDAACPVKLGEHKDMIKAYTAAVGQTANLASYELSLAKFTDLLIIFPDSPGSFAELGMFSIQENIARKMVVFIKEQHKKSKSFVNYGPVALAAKHKAIVIDVKYEDLDQIWLHVQEIIRERRQKQLDRKILGGE